MPQFPALPRTLFAALLSAWAAAIWFLSSLADPGGELGITIEDWLAHGIAFAVGGWLARGAFPPPRHVLLPVLLCVAWGVVDEWHQSFVPGRVPSVSDVTADTIGAVLGALSWRLTGLVVRTSDVPEQEPIARDTP